MRLGRSRDISEALEVLRSELTGAFLVGGSVRDALLQIGDGFKDLDVICSLDQLNRVREKGIPGFVVGPNRHGNLKLRRGDLLVDLFAPQTFYVGFQSVNEAIQFFDIDLNAVAISLDAQQFLDPTHSLASIARREFHLLTDRWQHSQSDEDRAVLVARLLRMRRRVPNYRCVNTEIIYPDTRELCARFPAVLSHHLGALAADDLPAIMDDLELLLGGD